MSLLGNVDAESFLQILDLFVDGIPVIVGRLRINCDRPDLIALYLIFIFETFGLFQVFDLTKERNENGIVTAVPEVSPVGSNAGQRA